MKIYTKRGDRGESALLGGERRPKNDCRFSAMGTVDELNAAIGVVLSGEPTPELAESLNDIQHQLFDLGQALASTVGSPGSGTPLTAAVARLEQQIDSFEQALSPLREFILPGGTAEAAQLHLARAICRRAERVVVGLARDEPIHEEVLAYLNRLGDLLFVMARFANHAVGRHDVPWQKGRGAK